MNTTTVENVTFTTAMVTTLDSNTTAMVTTLDTNTTEIVTTLDTNTTLDSNTTIMTSVATPIVTSTTAAPEIITTPASLPTECGALVDWISANEKPFQLKFPEDPKFDRRCNLPKPDKPAGECPIVCADGFVPDDRDTVTMKCKCDDESGCAWREPKRVLSCIEVTTPESTTPVPTTTTVALETTSTAECMVPDWQGTKTEGLMVNGETVYTKIRVKKQSFKKFSGIFSKNANR